MERMTNPTLLSASCLHRLYANHLIVVAQTPQKNLAEKTQMNACSVANIMAHNPINEEHLDAYELILLLKTADIFDINEFDFLLAILNACKLPLEKVLLLNYENKQFSKEDLASFEKKIFIAFGISEQELHISIPIRTYIEYADKQKNVFLLSHSLEELKNHADNKKKLWIALKKVLHLQ